MTPKMLCISFKFHLVTVLWYRRIASLAAKASANMSTWQTWYSFCSHEKHIGVPSKTIPTPPPADNCMPSTVKIDRTMQLGGDLQVSCSVALKEYFCCDGKFAFINVIVEVFKATKASPTVAKTDRDLSGGLPRAGDEALRLLLDKTLLACSSEMAAFRGAMALCVSMLIVSSLMIDVASGKYIGYPAIGRDDPPCGHNGKNCHPTSPANDYNRGCELINRCRPHLVEAMKFGRKFKVSPTEGVKPDVKTLPVSKN
ncbi:hypothetical protein RJ640_013052 [Escallonia rubra]|uniref:Uncharacterized protein n=1 Tax=Escallonia rubra TaxID=112253 RepID=A0AA88QW47_9ASTE|nr:hypothetical protein RJ640_013052 [Escallonia rubra]